MKKTVRRQREHLLKMEHMAKMEVGKKTVRRQREHLLKMEHTAKMEVGKKTVRRRREHLLKMEVGKDAGMGWIQGGVRNLFGHLDKAVDDWIDEDFKKTVRRQREHLLKMEHLAKMEVGKGMGWIQGGVRNLSGHLDKAVDNWIDEDFKKTMRRQREHLLKMEHLAKMEVGKGMGWIQGGVRNLFWCLDKAVDDWIDEDFKKTVRRQREDLLKMMEVGKDAGMGRIQGGARNFFGRLDKAVDDWIAEDFKKVVLRTKAWKSRNQGRIDDWHRENKKWIDVDSKKISRGTMELALRQLKFEMMLWKFARRCLVSRKRCRSIVLRLV